MSKNAHLQKTAALSLMFALFFSGLASAQADDSSNSADISEGQKCMVLFYSPTCPHCQNVEDYLEEKSYEELEVQKYRASQHPELFNKYLDAYDVPQRMRGAVPTAFMGEDYSVGDTPTINMIEKNIDGSETLACPTIDQTQSTETTPDTDKQSGSQVLSVVGIGSLALVDAVNPCAIAVLVILLTSIMSQYPDRKDKALYSGLAFSGAILATYFTIGTLIIFGFKSITSITSLQANWLNPAIGGFAILIGLFNLKDYFKHGAFGFAFEVPFSWRPKMKQIIQEATSPAGAAVSGLIVSLFLLPCTSGPYFVAGGLLSNLTWTQSVPWLLFYNLIFIGPMIGITLAVYTGFASIEKISDWREQNIERLHLVAGLILVATGIAVLAGLV